MAEDRDPMIDPMRASFARAALSRRTALTGLAAVGAAGFLAACGSPGKAPTSSTASKTPLSAPDLSDTEKIVNWSNWQAYMDVAGGKHPTLDAFAKATGIKVKYNEDYNDNDEFFAKVRPLLEAGKDTGRDVWCSTDWMVARLKRLNYIQAFDKANMPNAANVADSLVNVEFDPGRNFSLPWQSGFSGIAFNPKSTGGKTVTTMDQLLHDPALKGKVTLLTEMRDSVGLVLIEQGVSLATVTADQFAAAIQVIADAKNSGQIKGFTGNDYTKPLASGDTAACVAWTGDVVQLRLDTPSLGFTLPDKGFTLWSDNFVIPAMAKHKKNAELLIDHYYDAQVMAEVAAWVNYIPPVQGTTEALVALDPELAENELIVPTDEVLSRAQVFRGLTDEEETDFTAKYQAIVVG